MKITLCGKILETVPTANPERVYFGPIAKAQEKKQLIESLYEELARIGRPVSSSEFIHLTDYEYSPQKITAIFYRLAKYGIIERVEMKTSILCEDGTTYPYRYKKVKWYAK